MNDLQRAAGLGPLPPEPEKSQEEQTVDKAFAEFQTRYPAFKKNAHNTATLFLHVDKWPPSVEDLRLAHANATYEKRYNDDQPQIVKPEEAWNVDMQTLHDATFGSPQPSSEWTMDLSDLKKAAGVEK